MKQLITLLLCLISLIGIGQNASFKNAADDNNIPRGVLEAISYSNTRFHHLDSTYRCTGLPISYSIMGLVENGKNYFHDNLLIVSAESGYSSVSIKQNADSSIYAYAKALKGRITNNQDWDNIFHAIGSLSELPDETIGQQFAKEAFLYQVFLFLKDKKQQIKYDFPNYQLNGPELFGDNFFVHNSKKVKLNNSNIQGNGVTFQNSNFKNGTCNDYTNSLFVAADASNFSSRNGVAISAITIHDVEGSYAGCISWFQNPSANVSAHYVLRSSDGQITQMVCEVDKGWHVGNSNPYAIGFEHEGYAAQQGWYTEEMYQASADLARDICNSGYGINPLRTYKGPPCNGSSSACELGACIRIKGHQHFPSQTHTDPGIYWDWPYYYKLINEGTPTQNFTNSTGSIIDSGGEVSNYSDDERFLYLISFPEMESVTLNFETINIEQDWDYINIYNGSTVYDPLLKTITGNSIINDTTIFSNAVLIEFTSDCATNSEGYKINYTTTSFDLIKPTTSIEPLTEFQTVNFDIDFTDSDNNNEIFKRFYQVSYLSPERIANTNNGFLHDDFETIDQWTNSIGAWSVNSNVLSQTDDSEGNSNLYVWMDQNNDDEFLYNVDININGTPGNRRAGFHFFCDSANYSNRLNSYFIWLREEDNKIQLYKTNNDVFTLETEVVFDVQENTWYNIKCLYSKTDNNIHCFIDDSLVINWNDASPLTEGNYVSFRTGNSSSQFRNIEVYHNRTTNETISIGAEQDKDIQIQSSISTPEVGFVQSIVLDSNFNISVKDQESYKVDWTEPSIYTPSDINSTEEDTSYSQTEFSGIWQASEDAHSGIASYHYRIGTISNPSAIMDWQNTASTSFNLSALNLDYDSTYYIELKAINGAGLESNISSDGVLILDPLGIEEHNIELSFYPNPVEEELNIESNTPLESYKIINSKGQLIQSEKIGNVTKTKILLNQCSEGLYFVIVKTKKGMALRKITKH